MILKRRSPIVCLLVSIPLLAWQARADSGRDPSQTIHDGQTKADTSDKVRGAEILSDTRGVDFGPYVKQILQSIRGLWLTYIPEECRPPKSSKGSVTIRFTIDQDGRLREMHLDSSTHNDAINRSAWGAITGVGKFPPLPKAFTGPNLELRLGFSVNLPEPTK